MRLAGRRVLVTGAASGIGLAVARLFRQEGAQVAMVDRDETRLKAAAVEDAVRFVCDVADEGQVRKAVAQAASALGGLDGVVTGRQGTAARNPPPGRTAVTGFMSTP